MPNQGDTGVPKLSANAITAHLAATFADLPVYVHTIEHADGVVLVDTGMIDSTPELDEEGAPVPMPETRWRIFAPQAASSVAAARPRLDPPPVTSTRPSGRSAPAKFVRQTHACLQCHDSSSMTGGVPGLPGVVS